MGEENLQGQETGTESESQQPVETNGQGSGETDYSLAAPFLDRIPQEHRPVVEPYVKQWDAGVTRRFQDLHGELNPYKELGSVEDLQQMAAIIEVLNNEPERVFNALREQLYPDGYAPEEQEQNRSGGTETPGLDPEFLSRFERQEEMLQKMAEYMLNVGKAEQAKQEDTQLDEYLQLLHNEYGDFNDRFVLTCMYNDMDAEEAIKEWNSMIQEQVNSAMKPQANQPPILSNGGGGAVPVEVQSLGAIPRGDIRKFVANILADTQKG